METNPDFSIIDNPIDEPKTNGLFTVKKANQWLDDAKHQPMPKHLFGDLWCEGEVCILFSDTNAGKSILAVQIADSISRGKPIAGFQMDAEKQRVLYFDFELTSKQFEIRCSIDGTNHYIFDDMFERVQMDNIDDMPDDISFERYLQSELESLIRETGVKVMIIDNITWLKNGTETAKDALPLMKWIHKICRESYLSALLLAHTPKRNQSIAITQNDLGGSKMLMNFCDSCFAIGKSCQGSDVRYLKQIKCRNGKFTYDADNVAVCRICKVNPDNFVHFQFERFGFESEHLVTNANGISEEKVEQVKELSKANLSQRQIAKQLDLSLGSVNKYVNM